MTERTPYKAARCADVPPGKTLAVDLAGEDVLLCNTKEGFFAVSNLCSHAAAKLCDGKLKGLRLLCPLHGAAFDVRDGSALSRPATKPIQTFETIVEDDNVLVFIDG
ncbi:MAG: non-heme iron oxygenase ferredoxin subunit [Pseudomonadota bacterium]